MKSKILSYLTELEQNNNRDWYHSHKEENKAALHDFELLIEELILEIGRFDTKILDNVPKELIFRLVRDTRFSHDKSPYNPAFRCHISSAGRLPIPTGYYLSIRPDNRSFLGGGLFADMFKDATSQIREYIFNNSEEFISIIEEPNFSRTFRVTGTALKKVPKEYPADCAVAEYLKNKSWYLEYNFKDDLLYDTSAFVQYAAEKFIVMKPFNDFLNKALVGFTMPSR